MGELRNIKGIGDRIESILVAQGITSIQDLLKRFPVRYLEHRIGSLSECVTNRPITLAGVLQTDARLFYIRKKLTKLTFDLLVEDHLITVSLFNREYLKKSLIRGNRVVTTGTFKDTMKYFTASDVVLEKNFVLGIVPEYDIEGVSSKQYLKFVRYALAHYPYNMEEHVPQALITRRNLIDSETLMMIAHQPKRMEEVESLRQRMKYEELLPYFLKMHMMKQWLKRVKKTPKAYDIARVKSFIARLPFQLTEDQKQATNAIFRDFKLNQPMNRLLQGEVGSGKTIVTVIAALAVWTTGQQVAIMAPTEILADQNFRVFKDYLQSEGVIIELLTGSTPRAEREDIRARLHEGKIDILIGTHALIQDHLDFNHLGFAIIDEQHRFGVAQRQALREKGGMPDVLFLSATPIPRTLAITLYGDMDVSTIKNLPPERKPIRTRLVSFEQMDEVYAEVDQELSSGRQAYFIVPMIATNDQVIALSVAELDAEIAASPLKDYTRASLHGQMDSQMKRATLDRFHHNEIQLLISTTVVEVGVNVKNATVMVVVNAERFGLAQIHQLRGRIARGSYPGKCYLVASPERDVWERLAVLEETTDGFVISEADLAMRGPGELFGSVQSGVPSFTHAHVIHDRAWFEAAQEDASDIIHWHDPRSVRLCRQAKESIDSFVFD
jgi:ATP-dependent DNA helicase RecG